MDTKTTKRLPNENSVFDGPDALKEYLDPTRHPMLPVIELPESLNPFEKDGAHIFIKMPPPLSMKHFGALGMLNAIAQHPDFEKMSEGWIPSSGNMGMVLGILGRKVFGFETMHAIVPADIAPGKLALLKIAGIKAHLDDALPKAYNGMGMAYAKFMGSQEGGHYFGQYEDPTNTAGYIPLFDQVWEQFGGYIRAVSFGCGTAGLGNCFADCLVEKGSPAMTVAAHSSDEDQIPGMRSEDRLKSVGLYNAQRFSYTFEVSTYEAYKLSFVLCNHGLMLGPSSGASLAAMFKMLEQRKEQNVLQVGNYVVIGHDTSLVVLDKYTTQLKKDDFINP